MGRIERAPSWILKYKERIEGGTVTVEGILEEENKLRAEPIKISSVTRAINAMGCPITGLRRERQVDAERTKADGEAGRSIEKASDRIVGGPDWLQKYRERIEKKAITVEDILEEENKLRGQPIKLSTVTRAINTMGYPITELRRGKKSKLGAAVGGVETKAGETIRTRSERIERGPGWLQKYRERVENGTITVEGILEEENKIRSEPIKITSVTRAVNAMGYPIVGLRRERKSEVKKLEKPKKEDIIEPQYFGIDKISEETEKRFLSIKKSWEEKLGKSLNNDYFVNVLIALAKLVEYGKTLTPVVS